MNDFCDLYMDVSFSDDDEEFAVEFGETTMVPGTGGVDFVTDETLSLVNGILSVNTTDEAAETDPRPITAKGVYNMLAVITKKMNNAIERIEALEKGAPSEPDVPLPDVAFVVNEDGTVTLQDVTFTALDDGSVLFDGAVFTAQSDGSVLID